MIFTRFFILTYGFFSNLWYNIWIIEAEQKERGAEIMYNALDVARYIIDYEATQGRTVSNLRLQKLLYFVQCAFIGILGYACFDDNIEAWDYGPVVPKVYRAYKEYGSTVIPASSRPLNNNFSDKDSAIIATMLSATSNRTTGELVDITHRQDPWRNAYVPGLNNVISQKAIADYAKRIS